MVCVAPELVELILPPCVELYLPRSRARASEYTARLADRGLPRCGHYNAVQPVSRMSSHSHACLIPLPIPFFLLNSNSRLLAQRRLETGEDNPNMDQAMEAIRAKARDNSRTPIQWSADDKNAGFTSESVTPWMRIHSDYKDGWNANDQYGDMDSVFHFYKQAFALRKQNLGLVRSFSPSSLFCHPGH